MDGVEILSQCEVVTATACNTDAVGIGVVATIVVMAIIGALVAWHEGDGVYVILFILLGLAFSCVTGMMIASETSYPTAYETQYKVTVDNSVSMQEFNEYYEIIEQEGKIYTVREKKS